MTADLGYFTIPAADLEKGKAFYAGVFGWRFEPGVAGAEGYAHIAESSPPGGLTSGEEDSSPRVYFRVEDIRATVAHVRELGGRADESVESASGWSAACRDNQGVPFSLWQAAPGF